METPRYLQSLGRQKVLLIVGLVVAVAAGLFAGFTIDDGQVVPRAEKTYTAMTTVNLSGPHPYVFQTEIPAASAEVPEGTDQPLISGEAQPIDLTDSAVLLAYLAASDQTIGMVEDELGPLADGEGITAVSRTTQPGGDERFPGKMTSADPRHRRRRDQRRAGGRALHGGDQCLRATRRHSAGRPRRSRRMCASPSTS